MFTLRSYRHADFVELHKLDQICFPPLIAYTQPELRSYLERGSSWSVVAEEAGVAAPASARLPIAGFLIMETDRQGVGHVITIDVAPRQRRRGLGRLMLEASLAELRRRDGFMLTLEVAVDNLGAIDFYKKLGFHVVKTLTGYYHGKLDGLLLTRRL